MGLSRLPSGVAARSTASISLLAQGRIRNAQGGISLGKGDGKMGQIYFWLRLNK